MDVDQEYEILINETASDEIYIEFEKSYRTK